MDVQPSTKSQKLPTLRNQRKAEYQKYLMRAVKSLKIEKHEPQRVVDTHNALYLDGRHPAVSSHLSSTLLTSVTFLHLIEIKKRLKVRAASSGFSPSAKGDVLMGLARTLDHQPWRTHALGALSDCYHIQFFRVGRTANLPTYVYQEAKAYDLTQPAGINRLFWLLTVDPAFAGCEFSRVEGLDVCLLSLLASGASATVFAGLRLVENVALSAKPALRYVADEEKGPGSENRGVALPSIAEHREVDVDGHEIKADSRKRVLVDSTQAVVVKCYHRVADAKAEWSVLEHVVKDIPPCLRGSLPNISAKCIATAQDAWPAAAIVEPLAKSFNVQSRVFLRGHLFQLVDVLQWLHVEKRLVHRDIRPANLLWVSEHRALLIDFSFAAPIDVVAPYSGTIRCASP